MHLQQLIRKESQPKGLSPEQKSSIAQGLLKIIEFDEPFNIIHTLFGYTIGLINISINERFTVELKKQFSVMQQLFLCKMLEREAISLIVVDGIQTYKGTIGMSEKQIRILQTLAYSIQQTMVNPRYIYDKWINQSKIDEQNRQNERAFKKFLQQEAANSKKMTEEIESQGWECQVCLTQIDREKFGILECSHIFHPECIGAYLKSKIEGGDTDIICPMEGCGVVLGVSDIYQYSDPDLKQKFEKFTFNKFVQKNNSSTAWCPTAGCPAVFSFDQDLNNYRCPACSKHYCLRCKCLYHTGMSCEEYRINNTFDKNDQDFITYVKGANYKQCPKCNYWVERVQGCSTMTCKCGQQFCYDCGGTTCPHGSCSNSAGIVRPVMPMRPRPMPMPRPRPIRKR